MKQTGILTKMTTSFGDQVKYGLSLGELEINLTALVGKHLKLTYSGKVFCQNCQKMIKKSYAQGFCYPCSMKLASCDLCILKPETCHFHQGTCREPQWGLDHCFKPHVIYLANSSGLKVGITRKTNVPHRWIDQGATEALPIMEVENRLISGQIEVLFKKHIADKTDWRKMLKGEAEPIDLVSSKQRLIRELAKDLEFFEFNFLEEPVVKINYPIQRYPEKITSLNLDKISEIQGKLIGIKGQYLMFDTGVINIRSHSGYEITLEEVNATLTA
jgi:hypothetical protein